MEQEAWVMKQIKYHKAPHPETGKKGYILDEDYVYYSKRYNRTKSLVKGMWSDGATGFVDLGSDNVWSRLFAWFRNRVHHLKGNVKSAWFFVHDAFCEDPFWDDGTPVANWDASTVAGDILWKASYRFWSIPIWLATFLCGGNQIKKLHGWFRVVK